MCRSVDGQWQDVSASEVLATVRGIAKGLIAHGYGKGDAIAIMSRTRIEWALLDLAIWHVLPSAWTLGGALIVVFACLMSQRAAQAKPSGKT